jgi:predicted PurR-regulated permease PerM
LSGFCYGFVGFFTVVCSGFTVDCGGGFAFAVVSAFFLFFSFYVAPNIVKYFRDYFPKCKQTLKKQSFSLKSFSFTNILRWRMFYVETNEA